MDIVDCILTDHNKQRTLFAALDEARDDTDSLGKIWTQLKDHLESHAAAEENFFYPDLLKKGHGALDSDSPEETTDDAVGDHNEIAEAAEAADTHDVGSDKWWEQVDLCHKRNSAHLSEEERQGLTDFRRNVPADKRRKLGVKYLAFEAANIKGYEREKKDPDDYIEQHGGN